MQSQYDAMGEIKSVKLEKHQLDGIEGLVDEGRADNDSEALRMAIDEGLEEMGYRNGDRTRDSDTHLRAAIQEFARAMAYGGFAWIGVTFWFSLAWRLPVVVFFGGAAACIGLDRLLESYEPRVSSRLVGLFRGERA